MFFNKDRVTSWCVMGILQSNHSKVKLLHDSKSHDHSNPITGAWKGGSMRAETEPTAERTATAKWSDNSF